MRGESEPSASASARDWNSIKISLGLEAIIKWVLTTFLLPEAFCTSPLFEKTASNGSSSWLACNNHLLWFHITHPLGGWLVRTALGVCLQAYIFVFLYFVIWYHPPLEVDWIGETSHCNSSPSINSDTSTDINKCANINTDINTDTDEYTNTDPKWNARPVLGVRLQASTLGCPKKTLFLNFVSAVEPLVQTSSQSPRKKFQRYRPINDSLTTIWNFGLI